MAALTQYVTLLLITGVLLLLSTVHPGHSRLLYSPADCVNILTEGNATQFLSEGGEQGGVHLVLFYAGWCSHCKNMVALFKQFIGRTKQSGWSNSLVDISVVACAEDTRKGKWSAVCSHFSVTSVPTFRLLPPRPNDTDIGTDISPNIYSMALFYPAVVKSISEFRPDSQSQHPPSWPHFAALSFDQLIALLDSENGKKTIVVVVECPDSTTGRELMLRFGDGSLHGQQQLSLYRTVYRSWEDAEIIQWAPLLAEAGQLVPPFLLILRHQQYPKQLHFVLRPQDYMPTIKPEEEAAFFGDFISQGL